MLAFLASTPEIDGKADDHMQTIIECQVMIAPGLARALFETAPGSSEAEPAYAELTEATKACGSLEVANAYSGVVYRSYLADDWVHSKPGAIPKSAHAVDREEGATDA